MEPIPLDKPKRPGALRRAAQLYGNLNKLDRLGGGGLGLSTLIKIAAYTGLLAVLAVLVIRLRGIEEQLDPVAHGVEKLQRDVDLARAKIDEESKRSRTELEHLADQAHAVRLTVEHTADVEAKASHDVGEVDKDAQTLRDELQVRLDQIKALAERQEDAVQKLSALSLAVDSSGAALKAAADKDMASLKQLDESMQAMEASATSLQKAIATLPVNAAQAELAEVQANAGKLAQALSEARARIASSVPTPSAARTPQDAPALAQAAQKAPASATAAQKREAPAVNATP